MKIEIKTKAHGHIHYVCIYFHDELGKIERCRFLINKMTSDIERILFVIQDTFNKFLSCEEIIDSELFTIFEKEFGFGEDIDDKIKSLLEEL